MDKFDELFIEAPALIDYRGDDGARRRVFVGQGKVTLVRECRPNVETDADGIWYALEMLEHDHQLNETHMRYADLILRALGEEVRQPLGRGARKHVNHFKAKQLVAAGLKVKDVAEMLGCSPDALYKALRKGEAQP